MSQKKIKIISIFSFLLLSLSIFLYPLVANAQFTGIFDFFTSSLEGEEEFSAYYTKLYQVIGLLLLITYAGLGVSAYLLQWIISVPVGLYNNTLVWSGWNFTLGLANIFFILIFIIIALAYILKIETIAQKKILTNLILVALLVNFSLLLVGAVTDVATFFQNTILGGETNLLNLVLENLMGGFWKMITDLMVWLGGYALLYGTPFSAPFAQMSVVFKVLAVATFAPTLLNWILTIFFGLSLVGTLFLYFFFFTIRTYIIWALAVLAPLAFICLILPQTKKWWDEWLKNLLEWTFLGIVLLLWLVLGLKLMGSILPPSVSVVPIVGWITIGDQIKYFLFLFVYLIIGLYVSNKTKPALAATATALAGQLGNAVLGKVIMPGIKSLRRDVWGPAAGGLAEAEKWKEKAEERAKRFEGAGKKGRAAFMRRLAPAAGVVGQRVIAPLARPWKPELIKYAGEARKVSDKELIKIDGLVPADAEKFINALPISEKLESQFMARMADKETLEFTSPEFQKKARDIRKKIFVEEDPYFQKEAHSLRKALGGMEEEEYIGSKLVGRTGEDRTKKEKEVRKKLKETQEIIQRRLGDEGITIEAGLKLKYITEEEVDKDKAAAAAKAKMKLTTKEIETFLKEDLRHTTAAALDVKEFKPEDIRKMIDPAGLANRVGLTLGNPRNLQRIQEHFGLKKLKDVIEGRGGLDDATDTPEKLLEYATKINPAMARAILTSPAYREMDLKARKNMLDPLDQPTTSSAAFERRMRVEEIVKDNPILQNARNLFKNINMTTRDLAKAKEDAEIKAIQQQLESLRDRTSSIKDEFLTEHPEEKRRWEELERLMQPSEVRQRQRKRR